MNNVEENELRTAALNHFDIIKSWSQNFLYMVSQEWEAFMDGMIDKHDDSVDANDALIKEATKRVEFIQNKMVEELEKRNRVVDEYNDAAKRYKASEIGANLVRGDHKFYELEGTLAEAKKNAEEDPTNKIKAFTLKKVQAEYDKYAVLHQRYEEQVKVREGFRSEMEAKELEMRKFLNYMKKTPFTKTALNAAAQTLEKFVDIKEYNQKTIFEDAPAYKEIIKAGLLSDNAAEQLSKKVGSVLNASANHQIYSGEFSESDIQAIVHYFAEEMDKYNFKGFNFIKNTILEYQQNVSNERVIFIKMDTINVQTFLSKLIYNLSSQLNGAMHHGFDRYIATRNDNISIDTKLKNDEGEGKETLADQLSKDDIPAGGERIYDDKMFDVDTQDLMVQVRKYIVDNKTGIASEIFKILHNKLPERSFFYNPTQRLRTKVENALAKIVNDMAMEAFNGSYIAPKVKNIILDAIGGGEHVDFIKTEIKVIKQVLQYEFVKYMISRIEEDYKNSGLMEMDNTATRLMMLLKRKKNETKQEISQIPIIAQTIFKKPAEMAMEIVEQKATALEDKVDFLLNSKNTVTRDDAINNSVINRNQSTVNPACAEVK